MESNIEYNFLNSKYFRTYNIFMYRHSCIVQVLVEDEVDVLFWDDAFKRFAPDLYFEIHPNLGSGDRGKESLLKYCHGVGVSLIICVDSDHHYLLNIFRKNLPYWEAQKIKIINENPFVFQTYAYAIENYKALPDCLKKICCEITALSQHQFSFDFEKCLDDFSNIVFPLFLFRFSLKAINREHLFPRKDFWNQIRLDTDQYQDLNIDEMFEVLKQRVEIITKSLQHKYPDLKLNNFEEKLKKLGVFRHNVYMFIRGHDYISKVVSVILKKVIDSYSTKQKHEIMNNQNIGENRKKELLKQIKNRYRRLNLVQKLESMNCDFNYFLMSKIKSDIDYFRQYVIDKTSDNMN